jgi:predicted ThiF/HesA family dinucleotide-utilizing enzyme
MSEFVKSLKMISGYFPFFCTVFQEQKLKIDSAVFERQGAVRREQRVEYLDKLAPENHPQGESKRIFTRHHPRDKQHHRTGDGVVQQRVVMSGQGGENYARNA